MSKLLEDVVLSIAVALGFLIALYLSYALVVQGAHYPPTLITAFLAIAIGALIYRFMGGLGGTEFTAGLWKIGGSAAFLVGFIWFVGDRLRNELNLYESTEPYNAQIRSLEKQRDTARTLFKRQSEELEKLRKGEGGNNCPAARCTIADVRKLQPNDPFVLGIKRLVEGQEKPFVPTLRELPVRVAVVAGLGANPAFNICSDTLEKLNEGAEVPNPSVQFSRTLDDGTNVPVRAQRAGKIGEDICSSGQRDFDVQINCPVALKLFPDKLASCAEGASVRGSKVSIGSLAD
jgi:hypothetical protein